METNTKWARGNNHSYCFMPDNIPSLRSYREARIHYDAVTPFSKGVHKGEKPFGHNRRYSRVIMRREPSDTVYNCEGIVVKHYDTDIVKFHADGQFTFNGTYESVSTAQILQEIFGVEKFARRKGKIYYFDSSGKAYRLNGEIRVFADGLVDADSVHVEYKHVLNRNALKERMQKFAVFLEYACMVIDMTRGGKGVGTDYARYFAPKQGEYYSARNVRYAICCDSTVMRYDPNRCAQLRKMFFDDVLTTMEIADEAKRMEAMLPIVEYMGFCASTDYDHRYAPNGQNNDVEYTWRMDTKRLKFFFTELVKFHYAKEVFTQEPIPLGTIGHDLNKKYIEYGTE
jgi:hypothetical protein